MHADFLDERRPIRTKYMYILVNSEINHFKVSSDENCKQIIPVFNAFSKPLPTHID